MERSNQELGLAVVALARSLVVQYDLRHGNGQAGIGLHTGLDRMADFDEATVWLGHARGHVSNRSSLGGMLGSTAEAVMACCRTGQGRFRNSEKMLDENEIYRLIGEDGFTRLVAAFYRRVPQ